jgi:hypothetical protein
MIRQGEGMRFDRVMVQSDSEHGKWTSKFAKLLGTESIMHDMPLWPSDHFGIYVQCEYEKK